jgi:hypothetical protein
MAFAQSISLSVVVTGIEPSTDNIKVYDAATETVSIMTRDELKPLADIKLLTPKINVVGQGYQKVAEFEINSKEATVEFLRKIYFYNLRDEKSLDVVYDLRVPVSYKALENIYENVCSIVTIDVNGEKVDQNVCEDKLVGSRLVDKVRYDLLTEKSMLSGVTTVSVWTNVERGDKIEWIPDIFGVVVGEWAEWNSPSDLNLVAWWHLDESTGTVYQSASSDINLRFNTATGTMGIPGIFGNYAYKGGTYNTTVASVDTNVDVNALNFNGDFSLNYWVKRNSSTDSWLPSNMGTNLIYRGYRFALTSGKVQSYFENGALLNTTNGIVPVNSSWHMITSVYNKTDGRYYVYIDNNFDVNVAFSTSFTYTGLTNRFSLNGWSGGVANSWITGGDINIDEVSAWSRVLSTADINALYNFGRGLQYCGSTAANLFDANCQLPPVKIDFNVKSILTGSHLNYVNMDCTGTAYDKNNFQSPTSFDMNQATYSCTFNVPQGYDSNTISVLADSNKTYTIMLKDSNAPSTTITGNNTAWSTSDGSITLSATDLNGTGVSVTQYSLDSGSWITYSGAISITTDGNHTIDYNSRDYAGNIEITKRAYYALDKTGPTVGQTTLTGLNVYLTWINGSGDVIGGLVTDVASGVNTSTCQIRLNAGDAFTTAGTWSVDHCVYGVFGPVNNNISYVFNTRVKDNTGNQGTGTQTIAYLGDTVAPTTTDNSAPMYYTNAVITLTSTDGTGTGVANTYYCIDSNNTCTPYIVGTSIPLNVVDGFTQTFYVRYFAQDFFDQNHAVYSTGLITVNRTTFEPYPDTNTNTTNWLTITDIYSQNLFGFDYTTLGIVALVIGAIIVFIFRINGVVAIILSIPLTYAFLVLAGGTSYILVTILALEIVVLAAKIGLSILSVGNQGGS